MLESCPESMSSSEGSEEETSKIGEKSDDDNTEAPPTSLPQCETVRDGGIVVQRRRHRFVGYHSRRLKSVHARLEGSRRSARECRARRKMRYQHLEDMVVSRERAIQLLRQELEMYRSYCLELDEGRIPQPLLGLLESESETG